MIKGLYTAASAMLAGVTQQSLLSHNVANLDTPGFKQVLTSLDDYERVSVVEPHAELALLQRMSRVGELGLGVETTEEKTDYTQGAIRYSGETLDFALQGPGYFRVETPDGERYTRDGRFNIDNEGQLVTVDGYYVLDDSGQPITLTSDGTLSVSGDGTLFINGEQTGKMGIASFSDPETQLVRETPNTFSAEDEPDGEELGTVAQGYLENANINSADVMTQMVQIARHYEAAQKMVQTQDELAGRAISTLGKY